MVRIAKLVTGTLLLLLLLVMAFVLIGPRFGWNVNMVLSGSMEPAFGAGDAVIVHKISPSSVEVGDVITFRSPGDQNVIVSHRVVSITSKPRLTFATKGDANEDADNYTVPSENVTGIVTFSLPLVGYFASFAKSRLGLLVLLIVPGLIIVANEMRRIWVTLSAMEKKQRAESSVEG